MKKSKLLIIIFNNDIVHKDIENLMSANTLDILVNDYIIHLRTDKKLNLSERMSQIEQKQINVSDEVNILGNTNGTNDALQYQGDDLIEDVFQWIWSLFSIIFLFYATLSIPFFNYL